MKNSIYAMSIQASPCQNLVWTFDDPDEFMKALRMADQLGLKAYQYHVKGLDGEPVVVGAWHLSDAKWLEMSEGVNDSDEFWNAYAIRRNRRTLEAMK